MMFSEPEDIETDLIGKGNFLDQIPQSLVRTDGIRSSFQADIGEGVKTQFHGTLAHYR
jgi:hypothetical protein